MKKLNLIKSHWRQYLAKGLLIVAVLFFTPDQSYNLFWAIVGILVLRHAITMFSDYWSRTKKDLSLSLFMSTANEQSKAKIYASFIFGVSFIIGSIMGSN